MKVARSGLLLIWLVLPGLLAAQAYRLRLTQPTALVGVLDQLATTYGWELAYPSDLPAGKTVAPLQWQGDRPEELFERLFLPLGIAWQMPQPDLLLLRPGPVRLAPFQLRGQVLTAGPDLPLPGATIWVPALGLGTYSDAQGYFDLPLPAHARTDTVVIRCLGYAPQAYPARALGGATLRLVPRPYELAAIDIVKPRPGLRLAPASLHLKPAQLAGAGLQGPVGPDPLQAVQRLPGVAAWQDRQAALEIRGSPGAETLLLLDGLPIYGAGHFFGIYSAINGHYLDEIILHRNALPIAYGGHTGGLVELKGPQAVAQTAAHAEVSTLTSSLRLDLPLHPRLGIVLQGRTSYGNAAESLLLGNPLPETFSLAPVTESARQPLVNTAPRLRFYDVHAKALYRPAQGHALDLSFFHSRDTFTNRYQATYFTQNRRNPRRNDERYGQTEGWANTGAALTYAGQPPGSAWSWHARLYLSHYERTAQLLASLAQTSLRDTLRYQFRANQATALTHLGGDFSVHRALGTHGRWQAGVGFSRYRHAYEAQAMGSAILSGSGPGNLVHAYTAYGWHHAGWSADLGLRLYGYGPTGQAYLSPRGQVSRQLGGGWQLKAAVSRDNQFVRQLDHETPLGQQVALLALAGTHDIPVGHTTQGMAGAIWQGRGWSVDVELYHKQRGEVLENALRVPGFIVPGSSCRSCEYLTYVGDGRSTGLDVLIRQEGRYLQGWLGYSLSRHTRSFAEIFQATPFPAQNDRRHQLTWTHALRLGRWQVSGTYIFASGRPYTDFSLLTQGRDRRDLSPEARIRRLPAYHRLDLDLAYAWTAKRYRARLAASVYNLTNRANVDFIQYIYAVPGDLPGEQNRIIGTQTPLLGRTYNLRLEVWL